MPLYKKQHFCMLGKGHSFRKTVWDHETAHPYHIVMAKWIACQRNTVTLKHVSMYIFYYIRHGEVV